MTEQKFYLTFGVKYRDEPHPHWSGADPDGWVLVLARDEEEARVLVRRYLGIFWSHLTEEMYFNPDQKQRDYYPKGELAVISQAGATGGSELRPLFTTSDPEFYGQDRNGIVAVRIEGQFVSDSDEDAITHLGYEADYFHPACAAEGALIFRTITAVDREVRAFELDWNSPVECPVCNISIT